jgi:leucyl-tRNA synthetase
MQIARDWYREATADVGMHVDLLPWWIRTAALLVLPIAPHFSEHIWLSVLKETKSIQLALWPTPAEPVNIPILESGAYIRKTVKAIRDAETNLAKKKAPKGKDKDATAAYNPTKPKSLRIFVAGKFPDWQNTCVEAVQGAYDEKSGAVDDAKVREALTKAGLIKDKRVMPFAQTFKVRRYLLTPQRW